MATKVLDYDPIFGTTLFKYDEQTDTQAVGTFQDIEPLLDSNQRMRNDTERSREGIKRGWLHVMSIPQVAIPIIEKKYGLKSGEFLRMKDKKKLRQIYNDPDLKKFKTTDKKI